MVFTKQSGLVRREDPRLGELVRAIGTKSLDVRDLANCVPARQPDGSVGAEILKRIRELEGRVDKLSSLPLEKELLDVLGGGRDAEIAARYYGFDGLGAKSLRVVGREVGLTYERVRQIASAAAKRIGSGRPFAPALDRTLDFVTAQTPAVAAEIETKLRSEGLTSGPFRIEGILKAAELLGREPPFSVVDLRGQRVVLARHSRSLGSIVRIARRTTSRWGVANISEIAAEGRAEQAGGKSAVAGLLACGPGFRWLDQAAGWFWFSDIPKNPILNRIRKILSVANPIGVSELRTGIARDQRMQGFSPPRGALLELCRQASGLNVAETTIHASPEIDPNHVLGRTERQIVRILSEHGGVMARSEFEAICLGVGVNRSTFYNYILHSPVISKYAPGRYGLIRSSKKSRSRSGHGAGSART
jgi:hypothetical protein